MSRSIIGRANGELTLVAHSHSRSEAQGPFLDFAHIASSFIVMNDNTTRNMFQKFKEAAEFQKIEEAAEKEKSTISKLRQANEELKEEIRNRQNPMVGVATHPLSRKGEELLLLQTDEISKLGRANEELQENIRNLRDREHSLEALYDVCVETCDRTSAKARNGG